VFTRNYAEENGLMVQGYGGALAKLGRTGAGHTEWVFEAIQELKAGSDAERIGVWLDENGNFEEPGTPPTAVLRGEVWEEGLGGVLEWTRLTIDTPLPVVPLKEGLSCEYELEQACAGPILGPQLQLRRVLWVPVIVRRALRGLLMAGTRDKKKALPCAEAERVAQQLELLLELEDERRLAAGRKADMDFWLRMKRLLSENHSANMILGQLAESCTRGESMGGVGTVFALIGERKAGPATTLMSRTGAEDHLVVRAQSGDEAWAYAVNAGPLESLWRQAIEDGRAAVGEAGPLRLAKDISRIVAVPIEVGNAVPAVLLVALPKNRATLDTLDRMNWRAALAGEVFEQEQRNHIGLQQQVWRKALLESSEEPAFILDGQGLIAAMSRGAQELLNGLNGFSPSSDESRPFAELFLPECWEQVQAWLSEGPTGSTKAAELLEVQLKDAAHVRLKRLTISGEKFSAVAVEHAQRPSSHRPLRDTCETLQQAIEWLEEGLVVFDESEQILARNGMFLQLLGLRDEDGRKLPTLDSVIKAVAQNAADPQQFAADWRMLSQDCRQGTQEELAMRRPIAQKIERYARPIVSATGKKMGRVEVYRGAPALRMFQSKMALAEHLASLGQRVTQIVHELNNPLTTILGNAQRLVNQEGHQHSLEASQIVREAERASGIVRQLLNVPRETQSETRLLSLTELVESTLELERRMLAGSPIHLRMELQEGLPPVKGDYAQLQQVLLNLLQNAEQAMQESGVGRIVTVRAARAAAGGVQLQVQDDGPGIPESVQSRIFDPFFTTKPAGKGTGLGLAIVSAFVRQHGGTIGVFSGAKGGTRFVVELPSAGEEPQVAPCVQLNAGTQAAESSHAGGILSPAVERRVPRILVVEDEPTVAALIGDVLREEGIEVDVLTDSAKAVELTQRVRYDLAICDVKMPEMDGPMFFAALEQAQSALREHILFVTGDGIAPRTREFLMQHDLPYVAKPFRVEELCRAVNDLLWGKRRNAESWNERSTETNLGTGKINEGHRASTH
jgi:signal transduction histidine kinase/DNA-binding NarL/FixJ family response regulator